MTGPDDEKRYTEEEFALIVRRAIELESPGVAGVQEPAPPRLPPEGFTLQEIQEIVSEVGVHPSRVLEAADSLSTPDWSRVARFFGGPATMSSERSVKRRLHGEEMARLLDLGRDVFKREGEAHEVLGGVEWKSRGDFCWVSVRVTPHGAGSRISVGVDRRGMAFLSHWLPMLGGLFTAGITLAILDPSTWQAIAAVVSGGAAAGYGVGRTIWTRSTKRWKGLVDQLTAKMTAAAGNAPTAADLPGGKEVEST